MDGSQLIRSIVEAHLDHLAIIHQIDRTLPSSVPHDHFYIQIWTPQDAVRYHIP
jgi:hypothetical protein